MKKKICSLLLALLMMVTMLPVTAMASNSYYINGKTVHYDDFTSSPNECWVYANNIYNKIWGQRFSNDFGDANNSLRNLSDSELTLTSAHLKAYVSNAKLGAVLRICNSEYLHGSDGWGHSQIIVQKDSNGFTVFEGGLSASPYCREKYYTWGGYLNSYSYAYIKYIKWPGASAYVDSHTCDKGSYMYYWDAHPHYKCYQCSICGKIWADKTETTLLSSCDECRPGKPALLNMQSTYEAGTPVTFAWNSTANTTHYNFWLYRLNSDSEWSLVDRIDRAQSGLSKTLEEGNYKAQLLSYNSALWESDNSDWVHTYGDDCFFTVIKSEIASGTCGENLTWAFENGVLTIDGEGSMMDYDADDAPWKNYRGDITSVVIKSGATTIGNSAFKGCNNIINVTVPETVTSIGTNAFTNCTSLTDVYYGGTEAQWGSVDIGSSGNDPLRSATIHFTEPEPQPPVESSGTIAIQSVRVQPGKAVTVRLDLSANKGISNMRLQLSYPDGFTLENIQKGDALSTLFFTPPGKLTANPVNFVWDGTDADTSEGCILELTFRVADTVSPGDYKIHMSYQKGDVLDNDLEDIDLTLQDGAVTVAQFTYGDVNDDGVINMKDLGALRKYFAGGYDADKFVMEAADVNGDGVVNMKDLGILRRHLAGGYDINLGK